MADEPQNAEPLQSEAPPVAQGDAEANDGFEALQARIDEFNGNLRWKEDLVLTCLTEEIHSAYRLNWIDDANAFFRRAAVLKKRRHAKRS